MLLTLSSAVTARQCVVSPVLRPAHRGVSIMIDRQLARSRSRIARGRFQFELPAQTRRMAPFCPERRHWSEDHNMHLLFPPASSRASSAPLWSGPEASPPDVSGPMTIRYLRVVNLPKRGSEPPHPVENMPVSASWRAYAPDLLCRRAIQGTTYRSAAFSPQTSSVGHPRRERISSHPITHPVLSAQAWKGPLTDEPARANLTVGINPLLIYEPCG